MTIQEVSHQTTVHNMTSAKNAMTDAGPTPRTKMRVASMNPSPTITQITAASHLQANLMLMEGVLQIV